MKTNEPSLNQLAANGPEAVGSPSLLKRGRGRPPSTRDWNPVVYYRKIHPDMVVCMDELLKGMRAVQKASEGDPSGMVPFFPKPAA